MTPLIAAILALAPLTKPPLVNQIALNTSKYCLKQAQIPFIAIISVESAFKPGAISKSGDYGLAQVNQVAHSGVYRVTGAELLDVETNIQIGCAILNLKYRRYGQTYASWPSFYHSRNEKPRLRYWKKLQLTLERIKHDRTTQNRPRFVARN